MINVRNDREIADKLAVHGKTSKAEGQAAHSTISCRVDILLLSKDFPNLCLYYRRETSPPLPQLCFPYFDKCGVKRGSTAQVGETLRGEQVHIVALRRKLVPVQPPGHHTAGYAAADAGPHMQSSAPIEDLHHVSVLDAPRGCIFRMHFEEVGVGGLHLLVSGKVGKGRVHIVVRLAGQKLQRVLGPGGMARFHWRMEGG